MAPAGWTRRWFSQHPRGRVLRTVASHLTPHPLDSIWCMSPQIFLPTTRISATANVLIGAGQPKTINALLKTRRSFLSRVQEKTLRQDILLKRQKNTINRCLKIQTVVATIVLSEWRLDPEYEVGIEALASLTHATQPTTLSNDAKLSNPTFVHHTPSRYCYVPREFHLINVYIFIRNLDGRRQ
jgi:hypothetical protein